MDFFYLYYTCGRASFALVMLCNSGKKCIRVYHGRRWLKPM